MNSPEALPKAIKDTEKAVRAAQAAIGEAQEPWWGYGCWLVVTGTMEFSWLIYG